MRGRTRLVSQSATEDANIIARLFYRLPFLGSVLRCLTEPRVQEFALFCLNVLMVVARGLLMFGYPFLITSILLSAGIVALAIFGATLG